MGEIRREEAHPRSRGENLSRPSATPSRRGSSPLTRGKHGSHGLVNANRGLIPAHAGKTFLQPSMLPNSPGSSPLTRGKLAASEARALQIGLIPAHAGKTGRGCQRVANPAAHPRSRGENPHVVFEPSCCHGSSPLTRGKRTGQMFRSTCSRLIPAHAGKTSGRQSARGPQPAHPRSRGENSFRRETAFVSLGSSPLTRGKLNERGHD